MQMQAAGARVVPKGTSMLAYPNMMPVPPPGEVISASRPRVNVMGYGGYGDLEEAGAAAAVVGIGLAGLVLTILVYAGVAYAIGWGASKGWQKAKKGRRKRRKK